MFLSIMITIACAVSLSAMDYQTFQKEILQHAPTIEAIHLQSDIARQEGRTLMLRNNPTIESSIGRYNTSEGDSALAGGIAITQPLWLPAYHEALEAYARETASLGQAQRRQSLALFWYRLKDYYLRWVKSSHLSQLAKERLTLASHLRAIALAKHRAGALSRAEALRADIDWQKSQNLYQQALLRAQTDYERMIAFAGYRPKEKLEAHFGPTEPIDIPFQNPQYEQLTLQAKTAQSKADLQSHAIRSVDIGLAYDTDPDQSTAGVTFGIDLPLFDRGIERSKLERLKAKRLMLQAQALKKQLHTLIALEAQRATKLRQLRQQILQEANASKRLVALYQEGYKTAQTSLLQTLTAQTSLIESRRRLIETDYAIAQSHHRLRFLLGALSKEKL